ncbi:MAG: hypothetical protein ACYDH5_00380 [Acidimicrobiales bacterium]
MSRWRGTAQAGPLAPLLVPTAPVPAFASYNTSITAPGVWHNWGASWVSLGNGLYHGVTHPVSFGKALIDWKDWASGNCGRALPLYARNPEDFRGLGDLMRVVAV